MDPWVKTTLDKIVETLERLIEHVDSHATAIKDVQERLKLHEAETRAVAGRLDRQTYTVRAQELQLINVFDRLTSQERQLEDLKKRMGRTEEEKLAMSNAMFGKVTFR